MEKSDQFIKKEDGTIWIYVGLSEFNNGYLEELHELKSINSEVRIHIDIETLKKEFEKSLL